jgi:hypothetical protein
MRRSSDGTLTLRVHSPAGGLSAFAGCPPSQPSVIPERFSRQISLLPLSNAIALVREKQLESGANKWRRIIAALWSIRELPRHRSGSQDGAGARGQRHAPLCLLWGRNSVSVVTLEGGVVEFRRMDLGKPACRRGAGPAVLLYRMIVGRRNLHFFTSRNESMTID